MSEVRTESGLRSQLSLSRAERRDSGVYRCQAENAFGRSEHLIYASVQGNIFMFNNKQLNFNVMLRIMYLAPSLAHILSSLIVCKIFLLRKRKSLNDNNLILIM